MKSPKDTRAQILDVAEQLFSEGGFDGVSIRDITQAAKVNLAAIHYHFGNRQDLITAVFERRFAPVNEARLAALEKLQTRTRKKPGLEEILEAFIRPTVQFSLGASKGGKSFSKLFGRCLAEPSPEIENLLKRQFEPLVQKLYPALMQALPKLSRSEIFWCLKFTFGALHHWHLTRDKFLPPWLDKIDEEQQIQKLIAFSAAGFRAA